MNHIILDMDGTLIGTDNLEKIIPRPYLEEFFLFCFKNFVSVSIWTAAKKEWYDEVNKEVFEPILVKHNLNFRFVWYKDKCTIRRDLLICKKYYIKNLKKVWNTYTDMTNENTIIVDDNILSYVDNRGNAVEIKSFINEETDNELKNMIKRLYLFKDVKNVLKYDLNLYLK